MEIYYPLRKVAAVYTEYLLGFPQYFDLFYGK